MSKMITTTDFLLACYVLCVSYKPASPDNLFRTSQVTSVPGLVHGDFLEIDDSPSLGHKYRMYHYVSLLFSPSLNCIELLGNPPPKMAWHFFSTDQALRWISLWSPASIDMWALSGIITQTQAAAVFQWRTAELFQAQFELFILFGWVIYR